MLLLLLAVVAMAADPPLERSRPEPAPASMSAGAAVLNEAFTQEFAEERQPERVTLRYPQESWELDWDDWWAYRQGVIDLQGLVAKVRIRAEGAAAVAKPVKTEETRPGPGSGSVPVAWGVAGAGVVVVLVTAALLWLLVRKKDPRRPRRPETRRAAPPQLPQPPVPTRLFFHTGPLAGQSVPLGQGIRLGRERDCHVVVEDPSVSRHHADLVPSPEGWVLRDLGSSNGTTVNGVRIQGEVLLRGDEALVFGFVRASLTSG
jgi:hypothetical protein